MPTVGLRRFSKLTCLSTLFLIFVGGMVTSTGSGLAVPDWPLSYGTLFPPMVGGVFYEHGHRMVASLVGLFTLCLAIWLWLKETRVWVKITGFCALLLVITQGILGGITVLFYLPTPVSVAHGILAQTFFLLTIFIAYSQSIERKQKEKQLGLCNPYFLKFSILFLVLMYIQLILGAIMRHTGSGLAIHDFPTMGGYWLPPLNEAMLNKINAWRFMNNFDPVTMNQIVFHFLHRCGAVIIVVGVCILNCMGVQYKTTHKKIFNALMLLNCLIVIQILLGITTVLTLKAEVITSMHVVNGAATLGAAFLLFLRAAPTSYKQFTTALTA